MVSVCNPQSLRLAFLELKYAATAREEASKGPDEARYCSLLISCHHWATAPFTTARQTAPQELGRAGQCRPMLAKYAGQATLEISLKGRIKCSQIISQDCEGEEQLLSLSVFMAIVLYSGGLSGWGNFISPPGLNILHMSLQSKRSTAFGTSQSSECKAQRTLFISLRTRIIFDIGQPGRKRFVFDRSEPIKVVR